MSNKSWSGKANCKVTWKRPGFAKKGILQRLCISKL